MAIHDLGLGEGDDSGHTMGYRVGTGMGTLRRLSVVPRRWYWEIGVASSRGPSQSSHTFTFLPLEKITQEPRREP